MEQVPRELPSCGAMRISLPPMTRISRAIRTTDSCSFIARIPSHQAFWVIDQSRNGVAEGVVSGAFPLSGFPAGVEASLSDFLTFFADLVVTGATAAVPGGGSGEMGISDSISYTCIF